MKIFLGVLALVASTLSSDLVALSPTLKSSFQENGPTLDIMIIMRSSVSQVHEKLQKQPFSSLDIKAATLYTQLNKFTSESQQQVLSIISEFQDLEVKSFYITNRISVKSAPWELVQALRERSDIAEIRESGIFQRESYDKYSSGGSLLQEEVEWGVVNINAPQVWEMNITGEGIVIGSIDTGVRATHVDLAANFRQDHGWLDPQEGNSKPIDFTGYGTHLMGIAAGKNGIGVAPDAQWIACAGCGYFSCAEETLLTCGEFMLCPTNSDSSDPDCSKRPNIVNSAFGGALDDPFYNDVINSWKEVGIIPIFSSGTRGPNCSTVPSPADQPNVISVGGTNSNNDLTPRGSRGPSLNNQLIKPELTAPGINIRSAFGTGDTEYLVGNGTSMASSHVAGAIALLLQKNSTLTRDQVLLVLGENALRPELENLECTGGGVDPSNPWPNNLYGYGKIDVAAALASI